MEKFEEFERQFKPTELSKKWNRPIEAVRSELRNVPGVLRFVSGSRTYLRVPASVLANIEKQITVQSN